MQTSDRTIQPPRPIAANAFTIVELILCLAVAGILLAAVAVAFEASVKNYEENEALFQTTSSASQALARITSSLRTAVAVEPNEPDSQCSLITSDGKDITYRYVSTDGKIYLVTNYDTTDNDYVLCDNLSNATFTKTTALDELGVEYVKSVTISVTFSTDNRLLSTAVVIRKNL